jgi:serine/threonine protein kinase
VTHPSPGRAGSEQSAAPPRAIGGYTLLRRLAEGGMSSVYLALKPGTDKPVALKVLADHLADDATFVERFRREAELCLAVDHPNLVRALEAGHDDGRHYIALEYVPGPTARDCLTQAGRISVGDAVHVALEAARALEYLHGRQLVHRDIKPENLILSPAGVVKLIDLGLVRRLDDTGAQLTTLDQGFGTSYYMPYEQALNAHFVDGRSDIFALGATLYHLLTGEVPFPGANHSEVVQAKEEGHYKLARSLEPSVPLVLEAILGRMMARDPRRRFQSVSDLLVSLERTRLAAPLPSFGDLTEALRDPTMRARLTAEPQPTRPDLTAAEAPTPPSGPGLWRLRWPVGGGWKTRQATTADILQMGRDGTMPPDVRAARHEGKVFRPLHAYPEFRELSPATPATPAAPAARPRKAMPPRRPAAQKRWPFFFAVGLVAGAASALGWIVAQC